MANVFEKPREWRQQFDKSDYLVSTNIPILDVDWIQKAFAHEDMYWAKEISKDQIELMLSKSITLGLYKVIPTTSDNADSTPTATDADSKEQLQQIGMARWMTDFVTSAYLSDVYIEREYRGGGMGKWLIECCKGIEHSIPSLRRGFLLTDPNVGKKFYSRELGYWNIYDERDHVVLMTRKTWKFAGE